MKNIFKKSECNRLNFQNYVFVNIDKEELKTAVKRSSNVEQKMLFNKNATFVKFVFLVNYRLTYFHDFYRILVEREFLRS